MKIKFLTLFFLFLCSFAFGSEFGEYQYSQYLGIQQQLQNQRARAMRMQRMRNISPTRNIQYPSRDNPYPNINRQRQMGLTPRQRYSSAYYNRYYN